MDNSKVEFYQMISTTLDEILNSIYVFGVLFDSWIIGKEEKLRVRDSPE